MNNLFLLLMIHLFLCLVFFGVNIRFKGMQDSIYKFCLVLMLPVAGFLYFAISAIINKVIKKSDEDIESYLKYIHGRENTYIHHEDTVDFENEMNTVPVEDLLQFSDSKAKRAYLIYILKKDFSGHVRSLKKAIKSEDTETAHYAAAALMEIKKQFEVLILTAEEDFKENNEDIDAAKEYAEALSKYLKSQIADSIDYYDYLGKYSDVLGRLLDLKAVNELNFSEKIATDILLKDYKSALSCCKAYAKQYPGSRTPYILFLKIFYETKNYASFIKIVNLLKEKKVTVDYSMENIVDYWKGSDACL